jgi:phage baseplate assembly protein W
MANLASAKAFLGVGWAFPVSASGGEAATAAYEEDVREAILIILQTNPGERMMRPTFGAGLRDFVFEPVNSTTMALVQTRVQESLIDWEPRIDVQSVVVTASGELNTLNIDIAYLVRATNTAANLVYPFLLQEGSSR